ncbi:MAG TPA: tetratricopeptide repeat protein [Myxococcales bacterium]|nr:tetratricopeptide repeat protein [Myxococcales bacterium]
MLVLGPAFLACLLAAAPNPGAELAEGIAHFKAFDDDGAAALLKQSLADQPTPEQAAQAHLYLGLIAFNALRGAEARAEFELALEANAYAELPEDASPKAKLLLVQIRQKMLSAGAKPAAPAAATEPAGAVQTDEGRASRWPAWTLAAAAVAALGTGAGFGYAQSQAQASFKTADLPGQPAGTAASLSQSIGTDGLVADVLFGVGAAAGVAAIVLFAVPAGGETARVSLGPGALGIAW